nr:hypothetical protein [uncultured Schaedlerella sp.]
MSETVKKRKKSTKILEEERKKKKKKKIIIIICILLIIIAAIAIFLWLRRPGEAMNEGNYKQIMEDMDSQVQEGYFETYMNTEWTFPDGNSETTDAVLGNSPNNKKPIRCEILMADTEEVLYSTDVLPVGAELPPFKLDVDLDAGTYDAICMVYLLDEEEDGSYTDYSNAGFNVTINVLN